MGRKRGNSFMSCTEKLSPEEYELLFTSDDSLTLYLRKSLDLDNPALSQWTLRRCQGRAGFGYEMVWGTLPAQVTQVLFYVYFEQETFASVTYPTQDYSDLNDVFTRLGYNESGSMVPGNPWFVRGWLTQQARLKKLEALADDQD